MVINMTFLRQWLLGIVSCALLVSFCEQLTPAGALKKLMRFTGGLLLILSILQPVTRINLDVLPLDLDTYRSAMAGCETLQKFIDRLSGAFTLMLALCASCAAVLLAALLVAMTMVTV